MRSENTNIKRNRVKEIMIYCCLVGITIAIAYISLGGKNLNPNFYVCSAGDGESFLARVKSIQEFGIKGLYFNDRLGAPGRASFIDDPGMDVLLALEVWILNFVFNPSTQMLYFMIVITTFVGTSITMYYLLRKLEISNEICFVMSLIFSFGPYHFIRVMGHITVANALTIPLALVISLYIIGAIKEENISKIELIICGLLVGIGFPYFVFFALIIYAFAAVYNLIQTKCIKCVMKNCLPVICTVIGFVLTRLPAFVFGQLYGANSESMGRIVAEQEIYGLKIIQLLLPPVYTRYEPLRKIVETYEFSGVQISENKFASLGLVASISFLSIFVYFIWRFIKTEKRDSDVLDFCSLSVIGLILISTVGGFGEIFNWVVTPQIRCYNRVSILISCICCLVLAIYLKKWKINRYIKLAVVLVTLCVGMADQYMTLYSEDNQTINIVEQTELINFFEQVQDEYGEEALIYQLPFAKYPENGSINNMLDYSHFRGYLFTDGIKWSFGGVRGRDLAAEELYISEGMSYKFVKQLQDAGFNAVYIDVAGFDDCGKGILDFYRALGCEEIASTSKGLYVFRIDDIHIDSRKCFASYVYVCEIFERCGLDSDDERTFQIAEGLDNKKMDAYEKLSDVINISEYEDVEGFVKQAYMYLLGRDAGESEIDEWCGHIKKSKLSKSEFIQLVCESEEFRGHIN